MKGHYTTRLPFIAVNSNAAFATTNRDSMDRFPGGGDFTGLVAMLRARDRRLREVDRKLAPRPDRDTVRLAVMQEEGNVSQKRGLFRVGVRQ